MSKERQRVLDWRRQIFIDDIFYQKSLEDVTAFFYSMSHELEEELITKDKTAVFTTERYGYDGGMDVFLKVFRLENDDEYETRMEKEAVARAKAKKARDAKKAKALERALETEAEEFALYQKLQAKFGQR